MGSECSARLQIVVVTEATHFRDCEPIRNEIHNRNYCHHRVYIAVVGKLRAVAARIEWGTRTRRHHITPLPPPHYQQNRHVREIILLHDVLRDSRSDGCHASCVDVRIEINSHWTPALSRIVIVLLWEFNGCPKTVVHRNLCMDVVMPYCVDPVGQWSLTDRISLTDA